MSVEVRKVTSPVFRPLVGSKEKVVERKGVWSVDVFVLSTFKGREYSELM